jgi:gamma-glutamylputrescine oxidase
MERDPQAEFGATWYCGRTDLPSSRMALNFDLDVDVCVIGGGIAGLTVAREIVRRGWSVALVEARRLAWNASGRNAGFVGPGFSAPVEAIVERVGMTAAKALWGLSEVGVAHMRDSLAELRMVAEGSGWLDVSTTPDAQAALTRMRLLGQEFGAAVEGWAPDRVREVLKSRQYFYGVHFPLAFQIDPLAYALSLAAAAERAGAHIFEHTPALSIDPAGVRKRVVTPKALLRAGRIVLAGNIHLGAVAGRLGETLIPLSVWAGVTGPLGRQLASAITFAGGVSDHREAMRRYRIIGGDRLLWSGNGLLRRGAGPLKRRFEREIRAVYPQLGPVVFESFWSGDIGSAVHRMPQIGEAAPGVWLASGLGGQGLNTAALAGHLIARAIVEGDDTWRLFLPYELVWAGGRAGRAIFAAATLWSWRRETARARRARARAERAERRRRAKAGLPEEPPRPAYQVVAAAAMSEPPQQERGGDGEPQAASTASPQMPGEEKETEPASVSVIETAQPAPAPELPEGAQTEPAAGPEPDPHDIRQKEIAPEAPDMRPGEAHTPPMPEAPSAPPPMTAPAASEEPGAAIGPGLNVH